MPREVATLVRRVEALTPEIRLIELGDPAGWPLPPFTAGAHVDLTLPNGLLRSYSLCGDPAERERWRIAVRREPAGRGGSALLHEVLAEGDRLVCSLPRNSFPLAAAARRHVFLAAGIGVAPFLAMAATLRHRGAAFHLHLWARDPGQAAFLPELKRLKAEGRASLHWTRHRGVARRPLAELVESEAADSRTHLYACGPAGFLADFELATAELAPERLHRESFLPPLPPPDAPSFVVEAARSAVAVRVEPGESVLAALRRAGVACPASCEGGNCGACRVRVLAGEPRHADRVQSAEERERYMMICVGGALSERLVLDL